jgi:hypothetical protein
MILAAREAGDLAQQGSPGKANLDTLEVYGIGYDLAAHAVALAEVRIHT